MQIGTCQVRIDKFGSTVVRRNITPAEAAILQKGFEATANGVVIDKVYITDNRPVIDAKELERLRLRYPNMRIDQDKKVVDTLFPGMAKLPQTFAELGLATEEDEPVELQPKNSPDVRLSEGELAQLDAVQ